MPETSAETRRPRLPSSRAVVVLYLLGAAILAVWAALVGSWVLAISIVIVGALLALRATVRLREIASSGELPGIGWTEPSDLVRRVKITAVLALGVSGLGVLNATGVGPGGAAGAVIGLGAGAVLGGLAWTSAGAARTWSALPAFLEGDESVSAVALGRLKGTLPRWTMIVLAACDERVLALTASVRNSSIFFSTPYESVVSIDSGRVDELTIETDSGRYTLVGVHHREVDPMIQAVRDALRHA